MIKTWLCVTTYPNWRVCCDKSLWGVKDSEARSSAYGIEQLKKVKKGDRFVFYAGQEGIIGYFEVISDIFEENTYIWTDEIYPKRVKLIKIIELDEPISFSKIKNNISNAQTRNIIANGNAIEGKPMIPISDDDAEYLVSLIKKQALEKRAGSHEDRLKRFKEAGMPTRFES